MIPAIAAGVLALSALTGATGAAPAPAASTPPPWSRLCVDYGLDPTLTQCLYADGDVIEVRVVPASISMTNWTYPRTNGAKGAIKQANANVCMQFDADADEVVAAQCVNDQAESWINVYEPISGRTLFENVWAHAHKQADACLSGDSTIAILGDCSLSGQDLEQWGRS